MLGCREVIPPNLQDFDWSGTDNASWLMRMKKKAQYWLARGPRCTKHWYCRTPEVPVTRLHWYGGGYPRYENSDGSRKVNKPKTGFYLSRIQCWSRFHFAIQKPFFVSMHIYWREKDVPAYPAYKSDHGLLKLLDIQFGYKRDGDRWHILTAYIGGNHE